MLCSVITVIQFPAPRVWSIPGHAERECQYIFWPQNQFLSKMFDAGGLPVPTFGNWLLKAEWLRGLWNYTYVSLRFFKIQKTWLFTFFWVAAYVFSNTARYNTQRYYYYLFPPTGTKPQNLNIALSKVWLQRRLIGVEVLEEGDRISPLEGYYQQAIHSQKWITVRIKYG